MFEKFGWSDPERTAEVNQAVREFLGRTDVLIDDPSAFKEMLDEIDDETLQSMHDRLVEVGAQAESGVRTIEACQTIREHLYEHYADFHPQLDAIAAQHKVRATLNNEIRYTMLALQVVFAGEREQGVSP